MGTWIGGAIFQTTFTRADAPLLVDWVDSGWGGPFALYCRMSLFPSSPSSLTLSLHRYLMKVMMRLRLMISMGSWRFNVPDVLLLDHVSFDE
jgi:hypothetical protein